MADQGFASMDKDKQKEIAAKGGHAKSSSTARSTSTGKSTRARGAAGDTPAAKRGGTNSHRS